MFKKLLISVVLTVMVVSVNCQPGPDDYADFKGGEAVRIENEIIVPFQITDSAHRITVSVEINGTEIDMILDTGGQTFLEKNLKDSLELESFVVPANQAEFSVIGTTGLGGVEVNDMKVGLIEFEDTFKFDLNGMIGSDFLRFFQVTFDYNRQVLRFAEPSLLRKTDDKDHIANIEIIFPYFPVVDVQLSEDWTKPGMIDSGLHYAFVLPVSWIEKLTEEERSELIEADGYFARWPWHEDPDNYLYKMNEIRIGDLVLEDVPVIFSDIPVFLNDKVMLIGKFFMENYITTLDYTNKQVNFREEISIDRSLSYSAGIMLADKEEKLQITGVWDDSPADQMGLSPQDDLVAIEGKKFGEITNGEIIEILMDPDINKFEITILKDDVETDIVLTKKELLD